MTTHCYAEILAPIGILVSTGAIRCRLIRQSISNRNGVFAWETALGANDAEFRDYPIGGGLPHIGLQTSGLWQDVEASKLPGSFFPRSAPTPANVSIGRNVTPQFVDNSFSGIRNNQSLSAAFVFGVEVLNSQMLDLAPDPRTKTAFDY